MRAALAWAAIDTLSALLLVVYVLIAPPVEARNSIETFGRYVVVVEWPPKSDADVDTYVRDPDGRIVFFSNPRAGFWHLEHDDLGSRSDSFNGYSVDRNVERCVLRGVIPGESTVNVHGYRLYGEVVPVVVSLYQLQGADRKILAQRLVLRETGAEATAFRFTLDADGRIADTNHLPADLVH